MKNKLLVGAGLTAAAAVAFAAKDPVIMTVNGVDVPLSEFEYLYNKNSQQQLNPQPVDEYVEMFKLYKLKVADAKAEGLDTLASFRKEMDQYRHDLAAPYLTDSTYIFELLDQTVARAKEEVDARHIMLFKTRDAVKNHELRERADSISKALKAGADFAEMAGRLSQDRGSSSRGGDMGFITAGAFPYDFETAAYTLSEGEISDVVESPMGYHVLMGGKHRPARGKVLAQHILRLTQGLDEAGQARAKATIDSLYNIILADPDKFGELARQYSDDKGSARNDGKLPLFGAGEMVPEFDAASFALKDGEVSQPVKTSYGWHIIRRLGGAASPSADELKPRFLAQIGSTQDPRNLLVLRHQNECLAKKHQGSINKSTYDAMMASLVPNGVDSIFMAEWTEGAEASREIIAVEGKSYPIGEVLKPMSRMTQPDVTTAKDILNRMVESYYNRQLKDAEEKALYASVPDYRNLLNEYVDGSLLYEVSVRKVWDKAAKDDEGLKKFFNEHRSDYKWKEPRAKGFLVQAKNDSVAELIKKRAAEIGRDTLGNTLRKEFNRMATVTKVLEPRGANGMIDNLLFDGPKVEPASSNYTVYFMIDPRVISEPEDVNDVRGQVTSDYQNEFQNIWESELRNKYPVKVNKKVLKKVKSQIKK